MANGLAKPAGVLHISEPAASKPQFIREDPNQPMNFLEQLVAEWYEYRGYFVRRNVNVGRRPQGGHECELDVVAFHPETKHLVHIEPSMDTQSWEKREERFARKFAAGTRYIPALFTGLDIPDKIEQVALLGFGGRGSRETLGGGKLMLVSDLLTEIATGLRGVRLASNAVPEDKPLLRMMQFIGEHRGRVFQAMDGSSVVRSSSG